MYLALGEYYPDQEYHQKAWEALTQMKGTSPASERDRTDHHLSVEGCAKERGLITWEWALMRQRHWEVSNARVNHMTSIFRYVEIFQTSC
jgi:hypothetical protein